MENYIKHTWGTCDFDIVNCDSSLVLLLVFANLKVAINVYDGFILVQMLLQSSLQPWGGVSTASTPTGKQLLLALDILCHELRLL